MTNLKSNILRFVEKNKISMIPRWQFMLYSLLSAVLLIFACAVLVFLGSMIVFILSVHGFMYLPLFGLGEAIHGLRSIPGMLFLLTIVLVLIIELLVRNYEFAFRKPMLITLVTVTASSIFLSFLLPLSSLHVEVRDFAKKHDLRFISYSRPLPFPEEETTILRGIVVATSSQSVTVRLFDESTQIIHISTTTKPFILPGVGDDVVIFGRFTKDAFEAIDIRKVDWVFDKSPYTARAY